MKAVIKKIIPRIATNPLDSCRENRMSATQIEGFPPLSNQRALRSANRRASRRSNETCRRRRCRSVQTSRSIHSEMPSEDVVRSGAQRVGKGVSAISRTEGMLNRRRANHARSRSYIDQRTAEIGGFERGGVYQGEERDSCGAALLKRERNSAGTKPKSIQKRQLRPN